MYLPNNIEFVLESLHDNGFSVYVVGECVKDYILGKEPSNYEIVTSALPEQIKHVFASYYVDDTWTEYGTVTINIDNEQIEISTYRLNGEYKHCYKTNNVAFLTNVEDYLMQKDFTANAVAYSPWSGFVDVYGGISDIKNGIMHRIGKKKGDLDEWWSDY